MKFFQLTPYLYLASVFPLLLAQLLIFAGRANALSSDQLYAQSQLTSEQRQFEQAQALADAAIATNLTPQSSRRSFKLSLPTDPPCFVIQQVLVDAPNSSGEHFGFLARELNKKSTGIVGQCIGASGLQHIGAYTQNELIKQGYVTSVAIIKPQNLSNGQLVLSILPGYVAGIYRSPEDANINLSNALTVSSGDVLDLRSLEQSMENLRLPYNTNARINILPANQDSQAVLDSLEAGFSDLVIERERSKKVGIQVNVNNFGSHTTGAHQAGVGISLAEPLWSNDNLYVQYMHTLGGINNITTKSNNRSLYINYRYPYEDWQLRLTYNHNRYTQELNGLHHNPVYEGQTTRKQMQVNRVFHRSDDSKLTAYGLLAHKDSRYYVDDLEILVQRRKTTNYSLGLDYEKTFNNQARLNLELEFTKGIGALGAMLSPERYYRQVDSRPLIWHTSGSYRLPIITDSHHWGLNTRWAAQYTNNHLATDEQFTLGDRYAVRGFDGKRLLSGDKGMVVGQEIYYQLPTRNPHQIYMAIDKGWVSANPSMSNSYHQASAGVLGYRFASNHLHFDAYLGKPIQSRHLSKDANLGVQLTITY